MAAFRLSSDFATVYERHHRALYRYCRSILRHEEDAQDALQSTMTRAFAALEREERELELRPWLFRIAHNESVSILRRRRATLELADAPATGELEDRVAEREELRALRRDLAELPERQRAALILRELNGLSHAEIGEVLELSPGAVKTAIFEARSALANCREGRAMACGEVRSLLAAGDGRVLRGRGVRAHLRVCAECRSLRGERRLVFLPGAALLWQSLAGTAVKVIACVAIAATSTTVAVEMRDARGGPATAAAATVTPKRTHHTPVPKPFKSAAQPRPAATVAAPPRAVRISTRAPVTRRKATPRRHRGATAVPNRNAAPHAGRVAARANVPPDVVPPAPESAKVPPGQAKKTTPAKTPPGQAKKARPEPKPAKVPPGQAKKDVAAPPSPVATPDALPPGQAKKDDPAALPPGQAKKQAGGKHG